MTEMPDELKEMDRKLKSMRFAPRASFGPELLGRLRRGDQPAPTPSGVRRHFLSAAVVLLTAGTALALARFGPLTGPGVVTVDRCCYDLDGGGKADDGVLVLAERNARVHRLRIYEDLDGSGTFTPADQVRLDRGGHPALHGLVGADIVAIDRCCLDFDGGGPDDDGLLVIGVPPDRVVMAAIYEASMEVRDRGSDGWLLR
jgi:hypothetical protein